jgi:hypothetical protein
LQKSPALHAVILADFAAAPLSCKIAAAAMDQSSKAIASEMNQIINQIMY